MEVSNNYIRRNIKIIAIIAIFLICIVGFKTENYASVNTDLKLASTTGGSVQSDLGDLGAYKDDTTNSDRVASIAGTIVSAIQIIGTIVSVGALIAIGIKYMIGSVEERADYKKSLKPYIIGAFLLFTGSLIPQLIYTISQNLNK